MNGRRQRRTIMIMGVIVLLLAALILIRGFRGMTVKKENHSQGLEVIREQESADVQEIENKIQKQENKKPSGEEKPLDELFAESVVMGDSITLGLTEYEVLNTSNVLAKIGATVTTSEKYLDMAETLHPQVIFLAYGNNDLQETDGDSKVFKKNYEKFIQELQSRLPDAVILVNGIFPVLSAAAEEEPTYEYIEEFNEVLQELCEEYELSYIDNSSLLSRSDYASDGVHFQPEFYQIWAEHMAEEAAL